MHRQPSVRGAGLLVGRVVKGFTARRMADDDLLEARLLWRFFLSAAIFLACCLLRLRDTVGDSGTSF